MLRALREEVDPLLPPSGIAERYGALDSARLLDAVIQESMRLRMVTAVAGFEPLHDLVLGDLEIPTGTPILALMRKVNLDERHFGNASTFDPTRWLGAREGCPHHAKVSLPFGSGPRICPGRPLALLEMRLVLGLLVKRFDWQRVGASENVRDTFGFVTSPQGLEARFAPRPSGS